MPAPKLFSHSPQPLCLQAAALFRSHIQNRSWRPGQQIPPLEALVKPTASRAPPSARRWASWSRTG